TFMTSKPLKAWKPGWDFASSDVVDARGTLSTDALQSTRAIRTDVTTSAQIENQFDAIAYGKTAWVLRMAESYIGEEAFRNGVNEYIASNAYGNTAAEDFTRSMDRASSQPVAEVISSFIRQPGLPLITATSTCNAGSTTLTLTQQRFFSDLLATTKASPERWTSRRRRLSASRRRAPKRSRSACSRTTHRRVRNDRRALYDARERRSLSQMGEQLPTSGRSRSRMVAEEWGIASDFRSSGLG